MLLFLCETLMADILTVSLSFTLSSFFFAVSFSPTLYSLHSYVPILLTKIFHCHKKKKIHDVRLHCLWPYKVMRMLWAICAQRISRSRCLHKMYWFTAVCEWKRSRAAAVRSVRTCWHVPLLVDGIKKIKLISCCKWTQQTPLQKSSVFTSVKDACCCFKLTLKR